MSIHTATMQFTTLRKGTIYTLREVAEICADILILTRLTSPRAARHADSGLRK